MAGRRSSFAARDAVQAPRLHRGATPTRAAALVVSGLLLASLLTAPALADAARRQPYGPARTVLVEVAERLGAVSSTARLDVPWRTLDAWVHPTPLSPPRAALPPNATGPSMPTVAPTADPTAAPTAGPTAAPSADPTAAPTAGPTAAPNADPTAAPTVDPVPLPHAPVPTTREERGGRTPTANAPLRVWIAGDSMWERPGPKLVEALRATGVVDVLDLEVRYSTGLTRPDYFDWQAHAAARLAALDPELVLFQLGPNDSQPLVAGGISHQPRTAGFDSAYAARVRTMMEVLSSDDRQVLWIGLPPMRSGDFDQRMRDLDTAYATVAATVDGVEHVPTRALFSGPDGGYAEYLPGPDGALRAMRNRDGIHLSDDGAARLAAALFDLLDGRHQLTD